MYVYVCVCREREYKDDEEMRLTEEEQKISLHNMQPSDKLHALVQNPIFSITQKAASG